MKQIIQALEEVAAALYHLGQKFPETYAGTYSQNIHNCLDRHKAETEVKEKKETQCPTRE